MSVVQYGGTVTCDECDQPHRFTGPASGWAKSYGAELEVDDWLTAIDRGTIPAPEGHAARSSWYSRDKPWWRRYVDRCECGWTGRGWMGPKWVEHVYTVAHPRTSPF